MLEYIVATLAAIVSEWGIYNASLALLGLAVKESNPRLNGGITFTLIVPAKNEEKVLGRLLERLAHQQYDKDSYEVLVVEDSSTDRTYEVCESYARSYQNIKCMKLPPSKVLNGKSRAINEALKVARGNVIGIMDADSVPSLDLLSSVAARFANGAVAVQVKVIPLNARESLVARLAALEELLYEYTLIGRAKLGLFVRLEGTGSFVLKDVINSLNGFNENALTEDADLSYKIYSMGYRVEYVDDVAVMKEVVPRFSWLVKQRLRWYRGNLELISTSLKGGLNLWKLDSFMTFASPITTALYPVTSLLGLYVYDFQILWAEVIASVAGFMAFIVTLVITRRHMIGLPFAFITPILMNLLAGLNAMAVLMEVRGAKKVWVKTERSGAL
ncbi:MAG: glycosyltransferase family 2 protein [Sulfolobales archaeon]|jgi:cellulose synthase/poly-beta-1,6-N-acetylglucosamine synthase-like glycosyltransferase|nr:glycosyltransferase family 2 protein [Sulfolobales archaeon]